MASMRVLLVSLSVAVFVLPLCFCANILAVVPTPSYSHQIAFTPLWRELSLRGHKVTVLTTDPQRNPALTNLTEIDVNWSYEHYANLSKIVEHTMNMWNAFDIFTEIMAGIAEEQLGYAPVQSLMQPDQNFDVILVEYIFPEYLAMAELHDCPKILIGSLDLATFYHRLIGNPTHPILNPELLTSYYGDLNFKERVISSVYDLYTGVYTSRSYFGRKQGILNRYFNTKKSVKELVSDVDMSFVNVNPVVQGIRSLGPSTITIGGYERNTSKSPLSEVRTFFTKGQNKSKFI